MAGISGLSYFLNQEENSRKALELVWCWSFGPFLISLHWISFSLGFDLQKFFWLLLLTIYGLPAFLALIPSLFFGPLFFRRGWGVALGLRPFGGLLMNVFGGISFWGDFLGISSLYMEQ
jgi:apolipoprotein N-acyltransferase